MSFDDDDGLETEDELRESYPHLYGGNEKPYEPPGYKYTPEQQKFLDTQRAKLAEERRVVEEHGVFRMEQIDTPRNGTEQEQPAFISRS